MQGRDDICDAENNVIFENFFSVKIKRLFETFQGVYFTPSTQTLISRIFFMETASSVSKQKIVTKLFLSYICYLNLFTKLRNRAY